jgi:hypothetical protein
MSAELFDCMRDDLRGGAHGSGAGDELVSGLVELGLEALDERWGALLEIRGDSNAGGLDEVCVHFMLAIVSAMKCKHRDAQHRAFAGEMVACRSDHGPAAAERLGERLHVGGMDLDSPGNFARLTEQHDTVAPACEPLERGQSVAIAELRQEKVLARRWHLNPAAQIRTGDIGTGGPWPHGGEVDRHSSNRGPR